MQGAIFEGSLEINRKQFQNFSHHLKQCQTIPNHLKQFQSISNNFKQLLIFVPLKTMEQ
jgi:hypothetical protein